MTTAIQHLAALRAIMQQHQLDAWIIPSADPHLSEYLPEHWNTRSHISGFTGSVGTLVVTAKQAGLWVDSRYWEQATQQLSGTNISLQKIGQVIDYPEWLAQNLPENSRVGIAPDMLSRSTQKHLQSVLATKNIQLQHNHDIINDIWSDRPTLPQGNIYPHQQDYFSENSAKKLARIRQAMHEIGAQHHLISSLDDIAWITNLRGNDVPFNPVFLSHLLISENQAILFVDKKKLDSTTLALLEQAGINIVDYHDTAKILTSLSGTLLIDPAKVAVSILNQLPNDICIIEQINPSTLLKSIKSEQEIQHIREAMIQDGIALCGFFAEFEQRMNDGIRTTEIDVDTMLLKHRGRRPKFISHSFNTIAGFNANAAMPHYAATEEQYSILEGNGILLIDSGAQYQNGTTDITRVIPIGIPNAAQKHDFTLVLKAHIALAETIFPENIAAPLLDSICRKPLWQAQCNYGHGTGHGVGYFLNVHEGPQVIAYQAKSNPHHAMKAGMITSNEPGLYRSGKWGIRIENLIVNRKVEHPKESEFGQFLYFETITLCPIDTRLIEKSLLTQEEITWLNNYHAQVRAKLEPHTEGIAQTWLIERTKAI